MNIAASPNTSLAFPIEDVQGRADTRRIPINKVGIKEISYPVRVKDRARGEQHTVATFNMYVNLPHDFKGTHMSRLVEILHHEREISVESFDFGECRDGSTDVWLKMVIPTTSLCPCSKKISDYGAHNQRSHITLTAKLSEHMWLEELIDIAESEASCEENFESIHNHSAYAMIEHDKEAWGPGAEASAGDPLRALQAATCAPNHPP